MIKGTFYLIGVMYDGTVLESSFIPEESPEALGRAVMYYNDNWRDVVNKDFEGLFDFFLDKITFE